MCSRFQFNFAHKFPQNEGLVKILHFWTNIFRQARSTFFDDFSDSPKFGGSIAHPYPPASTPLAVGAPPCTPLGELTALPKPSSWWGPPQEHPTHIHVAFGLKFRFFWPLECTYKTGSKHLWRRGFCCLLVYAMSDVSASLFASTRIALVFFTRDSRNCYSAS